MFVITAIALVGLLIFAIAAASHFDLHNLTNIAADESAAGSSSILPHGYLGIWAAIPFAIWFFLAVEGVPLAAEETAHLNAMCRAGSSRRSPCCWLPVRRRWC